MVGVRSSHRKQAIDTEDEVPGEPLELSSLGCWLLLLPYSRLGPIGLGPTPAPTLGVGSAQMSYGIVDEEEVDAVAPIPELEVDASGEGLFIFSSRLQRMCVIASGSSGSARLEPAPPADVADVGRPDANDCVRFANDVMLTRASAPYVMRTETIQVISSIFMYLITIGTLSPN